jgi:porin
MPKLLPAPPKLAAFIILACAAISSAKAQTPAPAAAAEPAEAPTGFWDRDHLLDDWGGWRTAANDAGFSPFGTMTTEIWGNVNGGIRNGMTQNMVVNTGFEADLEKLAGWQGATLRASLNWVQGQDPDHNTGAFNNPSGSIAANQVRVYNLYLRQKLFDEQLTIKVGQIGADDDFFQCDDMALFCNGGFGTEPILYGQTLANGDMTIPQYAVDAPGVFVRYDPKDSPFYAMFGEYLSDPGPDVSNNHGFDWKGSNGAVAIGEAGWRYGLAGHDGKIKAGAYYDEGQFTDWNTGQPQRGIYGDYAAIEQTFLETAGKDGGKAQPVLSGYVLGGWAGPNSRVAPDWVLSAALNWNGPCPCRPNDVAGVAVLYTNFSSAYTGSAFNPNGPGVSTAAETVLEFTYQIQVAPWFQVQPDVQVIFNPANAGTRATALVVGARAVVTF